MAVMAEERRGALLVFGSAAVWSLGGAIARYLTVTDSWVIVFWRSVFASAFLLCFMLWRNGWAGTRALFTGMGWAGAGVAACFATASTSFVVALAVIRLFVAYVSRAGFAPFAWYRIVAGALAVVLLTR